MKAITRHAGVAIAICSWIAVSNHCAFAAVASEMHKAQTECPFHSKPAKQKEQSPQVQCCKILRAIVFAKTKDWARNDAKFCDANFPVLAGAFVVYSSRAVAPWLLDTGPPGAFSVRRIDFAAEPSRTRSAGSRLTNRNPRSRVFTVAAGVPPAFAQTIAADTAATTETYGLHAKTNFNFNRERDDFRRDCKGRSD